MIKWLLTELSQAGQENIWLSVRTYEPHYAQSVHPDRKPNIFPFSPPTQSLNTFYHTLFQTGELKQYLAPGGI